jgi:D-glycerate 3-kinase
VQVLILEGWFLACPAQPTAALDEPINGLERELDPQGTWRHWVNSQLAGDYQRLFAELDYLLYLRAPSMEQVIEWRQKQERKLRQVLAPEENSKTLSDDEVIRFVSHFERLTRHCFGALPERANWVLELDARHRWQALKRGGVSLG